MKIRTWLTALGILLAGLGCELLDDERTARGSARYEVRFVAEWSAATHGDDYPVGGGFGRPVGVAHALGIVVWDDDRTAGDPVEDLAERDSIGDLLDELENFEDIGLVCDIVVGDEIETSPGERTVTIRVEEDCPKVSFLARISPSPDWFVGVTGINMSDDEEWVDSKSIELFAYDAGTDDGSNFTSSNDDSFPADDVDRITSGRLGDGIRMGFLEFTRVD